MPRLKQFRSDSHLTYLVVDPMSGEAALIDPIVEGMSDYREYVTDNKLRLAWALDTHTHDDRFSASHLIAAETGARFAMSDRTRCQSVAHRLKNQESIRIGAFGFEVLETPGHTQDSICLFGHGLLFSGDALLFGCVGRVDYDGADVEALWSSLAIVTSRLPPETILLPCRDTAHLVCSTLGTEIKKNEELRVGSARGLAELKSRDRQPRPSEEARAILEFNLSRMAGAGSPNSFFRPPSHGSVVEQRIAEISVEKLKHKVGGRGDQALFVDVREPEEYREGRIPGSINIPLSELGFHFPRLLQASRIYFICQSGRRSALAARTLAYVGHPDAVNVNGGFQAWLQNDFSVEK